MYDVTAGYVSSQKVKKAGTHCGMYKYLLNLGTLQIFISGPENSVTPDSHTKPLPGNWRVAIATVEIGQSNAGRKETDLDIDSVTFLGSIWQQAFLWTPNGFWNHPPQLHVNVSSSVATLVDTECCQFYFFVEKE